MNPHGLHMRQLQLQRKMLNSKDWTAALMVKSRQWRDPDKFKEPHHMLYRLGYSELPARLPSWGQRISGREAELLQQRGVSRIVAQALK